MLDIQNEIHNIVKMECELGEIEIKIEYNEVYEDDPLAKHPRRLRLVSTSEFDNGDCCETNFENDNLLNPEAEPSYDTQTDRQYSQDGQQLHQQSSEMETIHLKKPINNNIIKMDQANNKNKDNGKRCNFEDNISNPKKLEEEETATWYKEIDENGKLYCRFCSLSYSVVQTLRYHIRTKHPIEAVVLKASIAKGNRSQKLRCHICKTKFTSFEELKKHVSLKHNIGNHDKFVCDYCQKLFYKKDRLDCHIEAKHIDSKGNFINTINKNIILKNTERKYPCPYCSHVAKRKYGLKTHIKARHRSEEDLIFICPFCPYKAAIKYYLQNHVTKQHPESEYAQSKVTHFCDVCGYRTPKKSHFIEHRRSHFSTSKKHKCEFCEYGTNLLANLEVHRRTHTKEKPFMCSFDGCEYRCSAKTALNSHKLKHDPEKYALYCDKCSYRTIHRHALYKHIDSHNRNTVLKTVKRIGI